MPIRFRCYYCKQLMGISRRKAGTVVRCPKCAGEIMVPSLDEAGPEETADRDMSPQAFEDPNFEQSLGAMASGSGPAAATAPTETAPAPPPDLPPLPPTPPPQRVGIFLPFSMLLVSVGVVVLLLILTLVIGIIIGRATVAA